MRVRSLRQGDPFEGGNGNPLQYSCQENPMDRGAWWAIIHGVAELNTTEHPSKKKTENSADKILIFDLLMGEKKKLIKIKIFASKKMRRYGLRHSGAVNISNI